MSESVITVERLSKRFIIGHQQNPHDGLRHQLEAALRNPWRWLEARNKERKVANEEFWALKEVSFEVKPGEVLGIIGRNGAGKSTLLKILSRITEPTEGRVRLEGRVASLLEVGTGFHPELTGRENIYLNGAILGMARAEIKAKFDEIVAFSEIEKFLDTPVKRYSSGMYVRLAFAVAAHLDPEILIVDEVLAVGDAAFQKKCLGKMKAVAGHGRTVLFVSHNMDAVRRLCSQAVLLEGGQIEYHGAVGGAIDFYLREKSEFPGRVLLGDIPRSAALRQKAALLAATHRAPAGSRPWQFPYGSPLGFDLELQVLEPFADLELGIGLFSAPGFEVASWLSTCEGPVLNLREGTTFLRVGYPALHLLPGSYYLGIGLRSDRGFEDYLPEAVHFCVIPTPESSANRMETFGGVLYPKVVIDFAP